MSPVPRVAAIVEGHGEVKAAPVLIRRIAAEVYQAPVEVLPPHRLPRAKICMSAEIDRALRLQVARVGVSGGVLVLFDSDDDDPDQVVRDVEATTAPHHDRVAVAVAVKEYEAWFLAALPSLLGHRSVRDDAVYPHDPERRRDCKKQLELLMTESYSEVRHQPAFSAVLDLSLASTGSPSFGRLVTAVGKLLGQDPS